MDKDFDKVFAGGNQWMADNNIISDITHNNIILNLYATTPAEFVEYFLDPENKTIEVILYIKTWKLLFIRKERLLDKTIDLLKSYLGQYAVSVTLKRYKKA